MVRPPFSGFDLLGFTQMCQRQQTPLVELRSSVRKYRSQSCILSPSTVGYLSTTNRVSSNAGMASLELGSQGSTEGSDSTAFLTPPTSPASLTTQMGPAMKLHIHQRLDDQTPTQSDDEIQAVFAKEKPVLRRSLSEEPSSLFRTSSTPLSSLEQSQKTLHTFSMEDLTRHLAEIYLIMGEPVDPRVWEDQSQDSPISCDTPCDTPPIPSNDIILQTPIPTGPPPPKPPRLKDRKSCFVESSNPRYKKPIGISKSMSHLPNSNNSGNTTPVTSSGGGLPLFPSERQRGVEPYQSPFGSPKSESFFAKLKKHRTTLRRKGKGIGRSLTIGNPSRFQHLGSGVESLKNFVKYEARDSLDSAEDDSIPEEKSMELSKSDDFSSDEEKIYKCFQNTFDVKKPLSIYTDDCKTFLIKDDISIEKQKVDSDENLSDDAKHAKAKNR